MSNRGNSAFNSLPSPAITGQLLSLNPRFGRPTRPTRSALRRMQSGRLVRSGCASSTARATKSSSSSRQIAASCSKEAIKRRGTLSPDAVAFKIGRPLNRRMQRLHGALSRGRLAIAPAHVNVRVARARHLARSDKPADRTMGARRHGEVAARMAPMKSKSATLAPSANVRTRPVSHLFAAGLMVVPVPIH